MDLAYVLQKIDLKRSVDWCYNSAAKKNCLKLRKDNGQVGLKMWEVDIVFDPGFAGDRVKEMKKKEKMEKLCRYSEAKKKLVDVPVGLGSFDSDLGIMKDVQFGAEFVFAEGAGGCSSTATKEA